MEIHKRMHHDEEGHEGGEGAHGHGKGPVRTAFLQQLDDRFSFHAKEYDTRVAALLSGGEGQGEGQGKGHREEQKEGGVQQGQGAAVGRKGEGESARAEGTSKASACATNTCGTLGA